MKTQFKDALWIGKLTLCLALTATALGGGGAAHAASAPGDVVGKVSVGYQGWFSAAGDGSPVNAWGHQNLEMWPDMREYTTTYQTSFANFGNGQPAKMFSSYDQSTVNVHFNWMTQNGIDTAALQRFVNEITPGSTLKAQRDGVALKVMNAAQSAGRKFYVMYDTSGGTAGMQADWTNTIVNTLHLTSSSAYAKQNGKPVVCIWGVGYHFFPNPTDGAAIINWFKAQGCYVIAGVPGDWRTGTGSGNTQAGYGTVWPICDMIMPWQVGGGPDEPWMTADFAYCNSHNIDYQSDVYPGFSFHNSNAGSPANQMPRNHGDFMWSQFALVKKVGVPSAYISMFDEVNEGTAIFKCAEDTSMSPTNQWFLNLDADGKHLSSDYYLRLTNNGGKMLKGQLPLQTLNSTPFVINSTIANGTYRIIGRGSGRALDVGGQLIANGSPIDLWDYNAGSNQLWSIQSIGSGHYKIIGVQSGRALEANGQGTANGTAIDLYDYNTGTNQQWSIVPTDSGYFKIIGVQSGRALDVNGAGTANGSGTELWDYNGGLNQQWSVGPQ
ncbi:MAG: RICIN domain-containing protein [Capsulimonas sp.]|uniref:RICIN domain-containing protein n=1 Tax=Capsulimonas sp. TaxID=2494211 RepID=UPI003267CBE1